VFAHETGRLAPIAPAYGCDPERLVFVKRAFSGIFVR